MYIPKETKQKLDKLATAEHRSIVDEIAYLVDKRAKEMQTECQDKSETNL